MTPAALRPLPAAVDVRCIEWTRAGERCRWRARLVVLAGYQPAMCRRHARAFAAAVLGQG